MIRPIKDLVMAAKPHPSKSLRSPVLSFFATPDLCFTGKSGLKRGSPPLFPWKSITSKSAWIAVLVVGNHLHTVQAIIDTLVRTRCGRPSIGEKAKVGGERARSIK